MMNTYEMIKHDNNGCTWNWEDGEENNVLVEAENEEAAKEKFMGLVSYEYEEEASEYIARRVDNIELYKESNHWTIWE